VPIEGGASAARKIGHSKSEPVTRKNFNVYLHINTSISCLMKKNITLIMLIFVAGLLSAQNYVSTEPQNKNAILEEFTGVSCPNCPAGHQVAAAILAANPGRAFVVAYHPANSSFTTPYPGDPDFRRTYPNAFYSTPYCGSSRFMPSSFINRRIWGNGDRLQSRTEWTAYANTIMAEASPANMGMSTNYDIMSQTLNITVEIYYTDDMTDLNHIYVMLAENDLVSQQSGASGPYTHKHTFREAFVAQWGDPITEPTTQGSLITLNYSWSTAGSGYVMSNCEVLAFIENQTTGEVITGVGVDVGEQTYIEPTADFSVEDNTIGIGGQAIFADESTGAPTSWEWTFEGGDPASSTQQNPPPVSYYDTGLYGVTLTVTNPAGENTMTMTNFIDVGFPPLAEFNVVSSPNIVAGDSVVFEDASLYNPTSWTWVFEGGTPDSVFGQNPPPVYYYTTGLYDVTLMAENDYGLSVSHLYDLVDVGTIGLEEIPEARDISVYPNPSAGILYIRTAISQRIEAVYVRNFNGQLVKTAGTLETAGNKIHLDDLPAGIYMLEIRTAANSHFEKIIRK